MANINVTVISTITSIVILLFGTIISILQWKNNVWNRKNALFDRRYNFYKELESWWIRWNFNTDQQRDLEPEDVIPFAIEAEFLFGADIANHIYSFLENNYGCTPWYGGDEFVKPFKKYLALR